jgi:internalin A
VAARLRARARHVPFVQLTSENSHTTLLQKMELRSEQNGSEPIVKSTATFILAKIEDIMTCVLLHAVHSEGVEVIFKFSSLSHRWFALCHQVIVRRYRRMHFRSDPFLRHFADQITELNLNQRKSGGKITDEGLSAVSGLTSLDLSHNMSISDLGLIAVASSLRSLHLDDNRRITKNSVSRLTGLTSLTMRENRVIAQDALDELTSLTLLSLDTEHVLDNRSVLRLTQLTALSLHVTSVTDECLQALTNLTQLELHTSKITDAGMRNLANLSALTLSGNTKITDEGMAYLVREKLTSLRLLKHGNDSRITDACLGQFTNLVVLDLSMNDHFSDAGISALTNLTSLTLNNQSAGRVTSAGIQFLTKLTTLKLNNLKTKTFTNAAIVPFASNLTDLEISNCSAISVSRCVNLTALNLTLNRHITNAAVKYCTALVAISLEGSFISIDGFSEHVIAKLRSLNLGSSGMFTDSQLARFTNLTELNLHNNSLLTQEAIRPLTNLTELDVRGTRHQIVNHVNWVDTSGRYFK